ncbi:MAG: VCBS repeat-containing protein, partial [Planctomycetota bacterium]|nr:VCBS repeat-containing protein [Planctomycetota bacterium]
VYATDLDGDGDADVLSASVHDDKIAWYENLGGGAFGSQQVITTVANYSNSVYATDLDGDGDADVLSASRLDDKIAWYENLGGGDFGYDLNNLNANQQVITTATDTATSVYATDLDGDGDADVLSASKNDDKIAWYENQISQGGPNLFCNPANTHSGGGFATLAASSHSIGSGGAFHLAANNGPALQWGFFLVSAGSVDPGVSVSDGRLCLTAPIGRYSPAAGGSYQLNSIGAFDVSGVFQSLSGNSSVGSGFDVPSTLPNPPGGTMSTGATWNFQLWYRDGVASNFSDGVSVTF